MSAPRVKLDIDASREKLVLLGCGYAAEALEAMLIAKPRIQRRKAHACFLVLAVPVRNRTRKRLRLALLVRPAVHRPSRLTLRVVADRALRHPQQPRNFALGLSLPHQK